MGKVKAWFKKNWKLIAGITSGTVIGAIAMYGYQQKNASILRDLIAHDDSIIHENMLRSGPEKLEFVDMNVAELMAANEVEQYAIAVLTTDEVYKEPPLKREIYESAVRDSMRFMLENDPDVYYTMLRFFKGSEIKRIDTEID